MTGSSPSLRAPSWLRQALDQARAAGLPERLQAIYQQLPATTCQRRGDCCGLLPPAAPVEMLLFFDRLKEMSAGGRLALVVGLAQHFVRNAAERLACPWARTDSCADYANRFFACRAYGLWSPEGYARRSQGAREAQARVARAWAELGVTLDPTVLAPGPDYCRATKYLATAPLNDQVLGELEERLAGLTGGLEAAGELAACGGDLSHLVARITLGQAQCLALKLAYTKAYLAGDHHQVGRVLKQVRLMARDWVLEAIRR